MGYRAFDFGGRGVGAQAAHAQGVEATELEDLKDVYEIDGGGADEQGQRDHDEQPAGVEVAFVV